MGKENHISSFAIIEEANMSVFRNSSAVGGGLLLTLLLIFLTGSQSARAEDESGTGNWLVGTWSLALDSEIFGLPPGFPLRGLAIFNRDGTYQFQDAGDFGQANFLNTQNSTQFGAWRRADNGVVIGTALFLEADLATGELLRWQKVTLVLEKSDERNVVIGTATVSLLECDNLLPLLPTALTCPDPIDSADDFVVLPPSEIPITLKRLRAGH
jgi:hypothetical protein